MAESIRILGIDPGSQCLGWGVIEETSGVLTLVDCGTVRPKGEDFAERLGHLFRELNTLVQKYVPQEAAIEAVFTHKNIMSAIKLGQARGVAVAACAANGVRVFDYEPTVIKKNLVGSGRAEKTQVTYMVAAILGVKAHWGLDTGDAIAAGICHLNNRRMQRLTQKMR